MNSYNFNWTNEFEQSKILECKKSSFLCKLDGICINVILICDGNFDCSDGSDETNCRIENKFDCFNREKEVHSNLVCNFRKDCSDNSDEYLCGK